MGQRLKSAVRSDGVKIAYTYNAEGLRTSKIINNIKFNYYWNDGKLSAQTYAGNTMYFRYDGDTPIGFEYNNSQYYYVTDLLGNVIAILDSDGNLAAEYSYDVWGNCTVENDTNTIAYINPLRYRGYYYDSDTDMYYLQSRYYDANIGRFINSDDVQMLINEQEYILQYNLFAYCGNNCILYKDKSGTKRVKSRRKYDRTEAKKYMKKWYNKHNKNFVNLDGSGGDCANFVSQCLYAGGFPMNFDWQCSLSKIKKKGFHFTHEWAKAYNQYWYMVERLRRYKLFEIKKYSNVENILKYLHTGDLLYFKVNGKVDHAAIISSIENGIIYYAQHTPSYLKRNLKQVLKKYKQYKLMIIHIEGYAEWR